MKAIRNLIKQLKNDTRIPLSCFTYAIEQAELETEVIENTFSEIAKLQQRILGDSKTIGGTAYNSDIIKPLRHCGTCSFFPKKVGAKYCRTGANVYKIKSCGSFMEARSAS